MPDAVGFDVYGILVDSLEMNQLSLATIMIYI